MQSINKSERRLCFRQGNLAGLAVLIMPLLSYVGGKVLELLRQQGLLNWLVVYQKGDELIPYDANLYTLFSIGYYFLVLSLSILFGWLLMRKSEGSQTLATVAPVKTGVFFGYLAVGMGVFAFGNFVSFFVVGVASTVGLTPEPTVESMNGEGLNLLLNLFSLAVLPAVLEELLFRGVVVGLLRPLGDRVALVISALTFALCHATLTQIPFAFMLSLMFGYIYIRTGNILLVMLLHFCNNAMSVMVSFARFHWTVEGYLGLQYLLFGGMTVLGAIAAAMLAYRRKDRLSPLGDKRGGLLFAEACPRVLLSPMMIVSILWFVWKTLESLNFGIGG